MSPGSGDSCSGELVGSARSVGSAVGSCVGAATGAACCWAGVGDSSGEGLGLGGLITVWTLFVHTAGFGLPVAAKAVSATIPVQAIASAIGASRNARAGAREVR